MIRTRSARFVACAGALVILPALSGCQPDATSSAAAKTSTSTAPAASGTWLTDVTEQLGIKNLPGPYADGTFKTPEITPGGVALFDYDGDGRLDILQIRHCPPGSFNSPAPDRLFHQEADGTFKEVPNAGGLNDPGFGHGVAVGDIDNDGDLDVFITNYGFNHLYHNEGNGRFVDITKKAMPPAEFTWNSSAGFLDYDRDGFLDLYVATFAVFDESRVCHASNNPDDLDYCGPHIFDGVSDKLYHNNGDGTFTDVTEQAKIDQTARGWGLACADIDGDGWIDIYVANDEEAAQLWINQHDGTFFDVAPLNGCAYNINGRPEAGMGVGIGDINGDGRIDLFKTHIASETNTLYKNLGKGKFTDITQLAGMSPIDRPYTGWGTGFFDFDNDGDLDISVVNGRVSRGPIRKNAKLGAFWNHFAEPKLLFQNDGHGVFTDVSDRTGGYGSVPEVSRGAAYGDIDGDGDIDIVVCNLDNTLRIYRNDAPKDGNHWLMVRVMTGKRDAYGATVTAEAGEQRWVRVAHPTYSFLASNDPRAHFGLGKTSKVDSLLIVWPDGTKERFTPPGVDRVLTIVQGTGKPAEQ